MKLSVRHPVVRVRIKTEGPLAALGHDRVFEQPVAVQVTAGPAGLDGARVSAEGDLRKTAVLGAITESDRKEMLLRKDKDMFETARYPMLTLAAAFKAAPNVLEGTLTLHGVSQPVRIPLVVSERDFGWVVEGDLGLDLQPFGIKPYKVMLGALRVATHVAVSVSAEVVRA
jgi:hypothetical protein